MAELSRAVAALRVTGADLSPDQVSVVLGAGPTESFERGDEIRPPDSRQPGRVAEFGMWLLRAPETEPADIDLQVEKLLGALTSDLAVWRELAGRWDVDLFCGWFMKHGNEGLEISPHTMGVLAARRIALNLDIYSGDDESAQG